MSNVPNWKYQKLHMMISGFIESQKNGDLATMIALKIQIDGLLKSINYPRSLDELLEEFQATTKKASAKREELIKSIPEKESIDKNCVVCGNTIQVAYGEDGLKCSKKCKIKYNNSLRNK